MSTDNNFILKIESVCCDEEYNVKEEEVDRVATTNDKKLMSSSSPFPTASPSSSSSLLSSSESKSGSPPTALPVMSSPFPFIKETSEHGGTRGSITLSTVPVCYRRVKNRKVVPDGVFMDVQVFQFHAKGSLKKCPNSMKNQERIFVSGDTVGVIMTFDPFTYDDEVWFIVTRHKNNEKKLWRRNWRDLKEKISTGPGPMLACEKIAVYEIGVVGEDPKLRNVASLRDAMCFCVKIGDCSRQNTLWVEIGMFNVWSSSPDVNVESFVTEYSKEISICMRVY